MDLFLFLQFKTIFRLNVTDFCEKEAEQQGIMNIFNCYIIE